MIYSSKHNRPRPRMAWWLVLSWIAAGVLLGSGLTLLGVKVRLDAPAAMTPAPTAAPTTAEVDDPYEVYLDLAPDDAPELTPDEALARAFLGCGQDWPEGTVDGALADAYRPTGICEE